MVSFSLLAPYLYYLAPPILFVYWRLLNSQQRPLLITGISCALLATAAPLFFVYVIVVSLILPRLSRLPSAAWGRGIAYLLGALTILFWKYILGFYLNAAHEISSFGSLFAVIGVSYMGLRIAALLISCQGGNAVRVSFLECLNFLTFFPTLAAGPLENINGFRQGYSENFDRQLFWNSIYKICFGLFKKLVVLQIVFQDFFGVEIAGFVSSNGIAADSYSAGEIFVLSMLLFLKALLDISAYTDLALGFAGLFGYRIINDINYPLIVRDLSEFWRSWHISIMRWCQTYIYFPVFLSTKSIVFGTFAALLVMGAWHNVEAKWLAWGVYQALGLSVLHQWNRFKTRHNYPASVNLQKLHYVVGGGFTFFFATFAFLIMGPENLGRSFELICSILGMS